MAVVRNPVLPGFHPDPCIVRHGDWFYLATSTFEWWPGVQINRSRDLANWELAGYAVTRKSQIDLRGVPDSGGVWAPALSWHDGLFWLIYSDVKCFVGPFKDVRNYLITAPDIAGPWSDPVYLNRSGFDPSLFHDDDGRKWLVNQRWKPSLDRTSFAGIALQEYSATERRLLGEPQIIFQGTSLGITEGPHLFKRDGYYYLVLAEGGTGWDHAVTVARSRQVNGPYEVSPYHPLLTSVGAPTDALQKAGHGSFVQDSAGRWYLAHLCSRPLPGTRRCTLGRETALQKITWPTGDWPRLADGGKHPATTFEINAPEVRSYFSRFRDEFGATSLGAHWNTLREPAAPDWLSLQERSGWLRLYGRNSIRSLFDQSLVGIRIAHHRCTLSTLLDFQPATIQQSAGLAIFYNTSNFHYLHLVRRDNERQLRVWSCDNGQFHDPISCDNGRFGDPVSSDNGRFREATAPIKLPETGPIELRAELHDAELRFSWARPDGKAQPVPAVLDASKLSDDYPLETNSGWAFTGVFAILCAQDATALRTPADFDWFAYEEIP